MTEPTAAAPAGKRRILIAAAAVAVAVLILAVGFALGRGSDQPEAANRQAATASPTAAATTLAATPSASPTPSPSSSPSYTPNLPTTMTDEGGDCIDDKPDKCGHYVAGSSCKNVEWCEKDDLVEPGLWATDGGTGLTDCMWGLSLPPEYGFDGGGYATSYTEAQVPKGAIFTTRNCLAGWKWLHP
ncbi:MULTISPECIES: hypothetical protein [unclassified Micromonospora]|uniref:hypothetical protein n=1 Tax=unclassified Micromonospora TaxID=2617518 RepID=UPI002FF05F11